MRESRGKAKQFTTINGKTVIIKDAFVYANKGRLRPNREGAKEEEDPDGMLICCAQDSRHSIKHNF
jgi:hypothetical protein